MIIRTLCTRQIHVQKLIDCRHLSCYQTKRSVLNTSLYTKNNTSCLHSPNRGVSSISAVTLPSWFVALSNSTPVAYAQQFVISVHDVTGTPWWASIVLSAVTLRLVVTLPLTVYQVGEFSHCLLNMTNIQKLYTI